MRLALLISGSLGYASFLKLNDKHEVVAIFTDKGSNEIISYTEQNHVPCFIGNPRGGAAASFISNKFPEVLISVNYIFLIEKDLIEWPKWLAFNIHGSLLPKYRGRTPHVWAIINNEKETGITAHRINSGCDTGNILEQIRIQIQEEDTGADILNKFTTFYPKIIDSVLLKLQNGSLKDYSQDENKRSYFGKRIPKDGKINWDWQRERIFNWVRAQAHPYPGAYSFINENKITIDKVVADDFGFHQDETNGLILTVDPLRVKTCNGVLQIVEYREADLKIQPGMLMK